MAIKLFAGLSLFLLPLATDANAAISAGEHVIVTAPRARVMRGNNLVATVHNGQNLPVLKTVGPWIGTVVHVGDKSIGGWIYQGDLANAASGMALRSPGRRFSFEGDAAAAPLPVQRSFASPSYRGSTPKYMLPKTDRNRFR